MSEAEHPSRMFIPSSASRTVFADTGLADLNQRSLERGPEGLELGLPVFSCFERAVHNVIDVCMIITYITTTK